MLTHGHDFELFIPICKEVRKIYRDHSHRPKMPSYLNRFTLHNTLKVMEAFVFFHISDLGVH